MCVFSSLVVKNPEEKASTEEDGIIDETDMITTYHSFRNVEKSKRWSKRGKQSVTKVGGGNLVLTCDLQLYLIINLILQIKFNQSSFIRSYQGGLYQRVGKLLGCVNRTTQLIFYLICLNQTELKFACHISINHINLIQMNGHNTNFYHHINCIKYKNSFYHALPDDVALV